MVDPATAVGLGLAVLPLIVSALENYEYTFQPIIIFSSRRHYQKEVEKFRKALKVQRLDFENECFLLLLRVASNRDIDNMWGDLRHEMWQDERLEARLKDRLERSYDACLSVLSLINDLLKDIVEETNSLHLLTQQRHSTRLDLDWAKRLRQKSKIAFSKGRFDDKLQELNHRIDNLRQIRKQMKSISTFEIKSTAIDSSRVTNDREVQLASSRLYHAISEFWRCESPDLHFANICLDINDNGKRQEDHRVRFNIAWNCPAPRQPQKGMTKPIRLLIDAVLESRTAAEKPSPTADIHSTLERALELSMPPSLGQGATRQPVNKTSSQAIAGGVGVLSTAPSLLRDLCNIQNMCRHLEQQEYDAVVGYFKRTTTFQYVVHTPCAYTPSNSVMVTLEEHLKTVRERSVGLPNFELAKLLALTVLRFHSTPWLKNEWHSQDVVFFRSENSLGTPYLRSQVVTRTSSLDMESAALQTEILQMTASNSPSPSGRTLYSLGVMLIELVYKARLEDLQEVQDGPPGPDSLHQTATRLGGRIWREVGPNYAHAVNVCLHDGLGASEQLEDYGRHQAFSDQVVEKLGKCADAVRAF